MEIQKKFNKYNLDKWLKKYNSDIKFFGIITKEFQCKIKYSFKKKNDLYKKLIKIYNKSNFKFKQLNDKLDLNNFFKKKICTSYLKYYLDTYYKKFDININYNKILVIESPNKKVDLKHKNLTIITNIEEIEKLNEKYDLIYISYKNTNEYYKKFNDYDNYQIYHLELYLKVINKCLGLLSKKGIISIELGHVYEPSILDLILLLNNHSSLFIFSDYFRQNLMNIPIKYIFSEFWKIDELKKKIKKILSEFTFKSGNSFLKTINIDNNIIDKIKNVSKFLINRLIIINEINNNKYISNNDIDKIRNYLYENVINNNIKICPENIPTITRMLSSKLLYLPNGKTIQLHSNINIHEGNYLFNIVVNKKMTRLLEVGFAYGISAIFMTEGLKNNKFKNKNKNEKYQLVSIDPNQSTQWHNLGLNNLKKMNSLDFHKLYEKKSLNILPYLLKEKNKQYDLIFIDGWHTFDYALVDLFYSTFLIKKNGYLILDDALHPGISKLIKYIDTNYMGFLQKIKNGPKTFGVYVKKGEDDRKWNYHKDF